MRAPLEADGACWGTSQEAAGELVEVRDLGRGVGLVSYETGGRVGRVGRPPGGARASHRHWLAAESENDRRTALITLIISAASSAHQKLAIVNVGTIQCVR